MISYELDHVLISVDAGAPEAEALIAFGLTEGSPNSHPGQGTANRRFFFRNAMIELYYVTDPAEAASESVRRTGLFERWQQRRTGASPFGICLRPVSREPQKPPFSVWAYNPYYVTWPIYLGTNSDRITEPLLCYLDKRPATHEQPLEHSVGFQEITAVRVRRPSMGQLSTELKEMARTGVVEFIESDEWMMEIGFDGEQAGKSQGFYPTLPLKFYW